MIESPAVFKFLLRTLLKKSNFCVRCWRMQMKKKRYRCIMHKDAIKHLILHLTYNHQLVWRTHQLAKLGMQGYCHKSSLDSVLSTLILSDLQPLLEVEIVRDDVAEKQQKILELTRQKDEMEAGCSHVCPKTHWHLLAHFCLADAGLA